jgi:hypothetical protein
MPWRQSLQGRLICRPPAGAPANPLLLCPAARPRAPRGGAHAHVLPPTPAWLDDGVASAPAPRQRRPPPGPQAARSRAPLPRRRCCARGLPAGPQLLAAHTHASHPGARPAAARLLRAPTRAGGSAAAPRRRGGRITHRVARPRPQQSSRRAPPRRPQGTRPAFPSPSLRPQTQAPLHPPMESSSGGDLPQAPAAPAAAPHAHTRAAAPAAAAALAPACSAALFHGGARALSGGAPCVPLFFNSNPHPPFGLPPAPPTRHGCFAAAPRRAAPRRACA